MMVYGVAVTLTTREGLSLISYLVIIHWKVLCLDLKRLVRSVTDPELMNSTTVAVDSRATRRPGSRFSLIAHASSLTEGDRGSTRGQRAICTRGQRVVDPNL